VAVADQPSGEKLGGFLLTRMPRPMPGLKRSGHPSKCFVNQNAALFFSLTGPIQMPPTMLAAAQRESQLRHLRESMRRANVPEDAINEVVEDQTGTYYVRGWVTSISYDGQRVEVQFGGEDNWIIYFPPNPMTYLQEMIRCQSHPHLMVGMTLKGTGQTDATILDLHISRDYPYPWPDNRPPFDVRTISAPQNTTLTTTTTTGTPKP
jgi:hypothetical protein